MLNQLKGVFESVDGDGSGVLELVEFVEAFRRVPELVSIHPEGVEKLATDLFNMIDANCDGYVDWDEFSNHVMLNQARKLDIVKREEEGMDNFKYLRSKPRAAKFAPPDLAKAGGPQMAPAEKVRRSGQHHDLITKILHMPGISSYVTAGRDGDLRVWSPSLLPGKVIKNGSHWITDMDQSENQPLAVAALDRSITFYDAHHPQMAKLCGLRGMRELPMSVHWMSQVEGDMLMVGDEAGTLHLLRLDDVWGMKAVPEPESDISLLTGMTRLDPMKIHDDWITKIRYMPWADAVVTCSMDSKLQCYDMSRRTCKWTAQGHKHGVYSFDVCRSYNFIASCGSERDIFLWNPFMGTPVATLAGHTASVQDVLVSEENRQMFSFSTDHKEIKVWDIRMMRCIQTIDDSNPNYSARMATFTFDPQRKVLVTGSSKPEVHPRVRVKNVVMPPVCTAMYNDLFGSVVVGSIDYDISVYDVATGETNFSFKATDDDSKLSSMCLDLSLRRLVTGGEDGAVRIWNFNNGKQIGQYVGNGYQEVCAVTSVQAGRHRYILAGGWSEDMFLWDDRVPEFGSMNIMPQRSLTGGHTDDVLCMCYCAGPTPVLATGGYDGKVILWKLESSVIRAALVPPALEGTALDDRPVQKLLYLEQKGHLLLSAGMDGFIRFWRLADCKLVYTLNARHEGGGVSSMCVSADATRLWTSDHKGFVKCWDLTTYDPGMGKSTPEISLSSPALDHEVRSDVRHSSSRHNRVAHLYTLACHQESISTVEFALPWFFITASSDGATKCWHIHGRQVGTFGVHTWQSKDEATWVDAEPCFHSTDPEFDPIEEDAEGEEAARLEKEEEARYQQQLLDIQLNQICTSKNGHPGMVRKLQSHVQSHALKLPVKEMEIIGRNPLEGVWEGRGRSTARSRVTKHGRSQRSLGHVPPGTGGSGMRSGASTARF
mmetsp:Transcript_68762/g.217467  ORF Transcript_68762/g.217467 Transcript_68762/m.217467 type:complete len:940 (+) Transcript_68762:3-2822(+)